MKYKLTLLFILVTGMAKPCGGWDYYIFEKYYNIFDQNNINSIPYYPFLRDEFDVYYSGNESNITNTRLGNLNLWNEILPDISIEKLNELVYNNNHSILKSNSKLDRSIKAYVSFANKYSLYDEDQYIDFWDYAHYLNKSNRENIDFKSLLNEAKWLFYAEKNTQLKARYGYQIVKLMHHAKQYDTAIKFFNDEVVDKFDKNEIYYYTLDRIAGCFYAIKDYDKAAFLFILVFNKSDDRKTSAFESFNLCTSKGFEGKKYLKDHEVDYITIKSLRTFSDGLAGVEELFKLAPNDKRLELLFIRSLNKIETEVLPKSTKRVYLVNPMSVKTKKDYNKLLEIAEKQSISKKIDNKDFWKLASSYLSFLNGKLYIANQKLLTVRSKEFNENKKALTYIYEVSSWKKMDDNKEAYLSKILTKDIISKNTDNSYWGQKRFLKEKYKYVIDYVSQLYIQENKEIKLYLLNNTAEDIEHYATLEFINKLTDFAGKKDKTAFEKLLMVSIDSVINGLNGSAFLTYAKGINYLKNYQPKLASIYLDLALQKVTKPKERKLSNYISAKIFSNNIKECFSCPENTIMTDSVYLTFTFIDAKFNISDLASNLNELEKLTNSDLNWKRKLANYLLGNYYYNISDGGYYRNIMYGWENGGYSGYFNGYNQSFYKNENQNHIKYYKKAYNYYQNVLNISTDKELNARVLYMMSKCELSNMYFNENRNDYTQKGYDYHGEINKTSIKYKKNFNILNKDYSNTQFHKMIKKECSFFKYYSTQ